MCRPYFYLITKMRITTDRIEKQTSYYTRSKKPPCWHYQTGQDQHAKNKMKVKLENLDNTPELEQEA